MAAPPLPTEKPPIWANFLNYTLGPDAGTVTKVDSGSVAGNGHIPGIDFPTTGQEQNHWQHHASTNIQFMYDSIGLEGTPNADNDPRVLITSANGTASFNRLRLWSTNSLTLPTLDAFASSNGRETIYSQIPNGTAPCQLIEPVSSAARGYGIQVDGKSNPVFNPAGVLVETVHTQLPAILSSIDESEIGGANVAIQGVGPAGIVGANGGDGVLGIAGDVGAGSLGGAGVHGIALGLTEIGGDFSNLIPSQWFQAKAIRANALGGTGISATASTGLGGEFRATSTGAPIRLEPQTTDPSGTGGGSSSGAIWIKEDVVQDEFWILANLSGDDSRRRSVATYAQKYCKLGVQESGSNANENIPTIIADNISFPPGMIPDVGIKCLFTWTGWVQVSGGNMLTRNENIAEVEIFEGASAIQSIIYQRGTTFRPTPPTVAGDPVLWGERVSEGFAYAEERWIGNLGAGGANDFRIEFRRLAADGGTVILSNGVLTIETID